MKDVTVFTVGHSTRSAEEFLSVLTAHRVKQLVDVRSFPGSRRYPQFNKGRLAASLAAVQIDYHHLRKLGGRRKPTPDSKNTAWKHPAFRAYADHLDTAEFKQGVKELLELARSTTTAIMCAESLWWKCHRSLISDYLKSNGIEVIHLLNEVQTEVHPYTSAARIIDGRLSYEGLI